MPRQYYHVNKNCRHRLSLLWAMLWKFSKTLLILGALAFSLSPTCQTSFLEPEAPCRAHFISLHTWYLLRSRSTSNNHFAYKASCNVFQQDVIPSLCSVEINYSIKNSTKLFYSNLLRKQPIPM